MQDAEPFELRPSRPRSTRRTGWWLGLIVCTLYGTARASELHEAAEMGALDKVLAILKHHPEAVNEKDSSGCTPLHWAADTDRPDVVKALLAAHANVDAQNNIGQTPLYWAAFDGHADIVKLLLEQHADPRLKARDGSTPYSVASSGLDGWRNPEVVKLFEERIAAPAMK
ncbi:MAG: ankyrin repeat domain-containing protein [Planctomycetota bacterium]